MEEEADPRRSFGLPGVVLVLLGALLVLVSFRFLDWYSASSGADSAGSITFAALHASADQLGGAGVATAYFDWLAWLLLLAVIVVGVLANMPIGAADLLRVTGFLLGLLGTAGTYYAMAQHDNATGSKHGVFDNASWGLWAALLGFLAAGAGAALGPRRPRSRPAESA